MKTFKLLFLPIFILVMVSCDQEYSESIDPAENISSSEKIPSVTQADNYSQQNFFSDYYYEGLGLEASDMQLIGTLHNDYALMLQDLMDLTCVDCLDEFNNELTSLLQSEFQSLGYDEGDNIATVIIDESLEDALELKSVDFDFVEWDDNYMTTEFNTDFQKIIDVVYSANSIGKLDNKLNNFVKYVNQSTYSTYEKEVLITSAEIARNSFKLWAPVSMNGLGYYSTINGFVSENDSNDSRWCWRCAAAGDVAGLASYFMSVGIAGSISAALIPGTNAALAAGAAGAAVGGSIVAGSGVTNVP